MVDLVDSTDVVLVAGFDGFAVADAEDEAAGVAFEMFFVGAGGAEEIVQELFAFEGLHGLVTCCHLGHC